MKALREIIDRISFFILKRKARMLKRDKSFHNFDSASTAGIVFSATTQDTYIMAKEFIKFLEKKKIKVSALGYVSNKDVIAYFPYHKGVEFFSISNLNWYQRPVSSTIDEFMNKPLDILIDLSDENYFPVHYIIALSKAKFKITKNDIINTYSDLILNIDDNVDLVYYLDQIKHYMAAIRKSD